MSELSRTPIFDAGERSDASPAEHSEDTYSFLNRVAGDFWEHPRRLVQAWADRLPSAEYNDLRARLRARDDDQFHSAFLELYLHEALIRAGYTVTIHPKMESTSRRPDFYAERNGEHFYLEAVAPGASRQAKAAAGRRSVLFDTVNRLDDPNSMLWLDELEEGPKPPAAARLRAALQRWLSCHDPDDYDDLERAPTLEWSHDGWRAQFRAIPIRPDARGHRQGGRAIGVYAHGGASFIDDAPGIRSALGAKHRAYGDLNAPFVVAIGTYIHDRDNWHSSNALYGRTAVQWWDGPDGKTQTRHVRQPDGYFGTPPAWQNRQVSGVLLVNQLQPYSVPRAEVTLWMHPNPTHPLTQGHGLPAETVWLDGDQLARDPAPTTATELFGLHGDWPPGEPFPND